MLSRTYPAEYTTFGGDELIISQIRDKIGDRCQLKRYYLVPSTPDMARYIMGDKRTFYDQDNKFWPYSVTVDTTTYSGSTDPQVLNYHFLNFNGGTTDLTTDTLDFWLESFYLSDFEIWTAYLAADVTSFLRNPDCATEEMEILKAALDLLPTLRALKVNTWYQDHTVVDNDTQYRRSGISSKDPFKDLQDKLQKELDFLIDKCNKTPYVGGIRLE